MTRVLSTRGRHYTNGRGPGVPLCVRRGEDLGTCRADDVERTGHDDQAVGIDHALRPRQGGRDVAFDDHRQTERPPGVGHLVGGHGAWRRRLTDHHGAHPGVDQWHQHGGGISAREHAHDRDARTVDGELLAERDPERRHAGRVVRTVEHQQRTTPEDLEAAGHPHRGQAVGHDLGIERLPEERLHRGQGHGGVAPLVGAVERHEHVVVSPSGRPQSDQPATHGDVVSVAAEVSSGQPEGGRPRRLRPRRR